MIVKKMWLFNHCLKVDFEGRFQFIKAFQVKCWPLSQVKDRIPQTLPLHVTSYFVRYALRYLRRVSHIGFRSMKWQWCVQKAWKVAYSVKWSVLVARKSNTKHRGCNYISFVPLKIPSNRRWNHQMFSDDDVSLFFIVKNYNFEEFIANTKGIN